MLPALRTLWPNSGSVLAPRGDRQRHRWFLSPQRGSGAAGAAVSSPAGGEAPTPPAPFWVPALGGRSPPAGPAVRGCCPQRAALGVSRAERWGLGVLPRRRPQVKSRAAGLGGMLAGGGRCWGCCLKIRNALAA